MLANVGARDRVIRIAAGLVLIAAAAIWPRTAWGWLGVVPLATGLLRHCPVYALFRINTCGY